MYQLAGTPHPHTKKGVRETCTFRDLKNYDSLKQEPVLNHEYEAVATLHVTETFPVAML